MKVAIIGKSRFNGILMEQLSNDGLEAFVLENINEIKSINGEIGKFIIKIQDEAVEAGHIIVAEEPVTLDGFDNSDSKGKPVVILLDYPGESSAYLTETALVKAIQMAKRQKKVVYLSKFMRVSGNGLENLYKEARNLGVVFIKYNEVDILKDKDTGLININLTDEYDKLSIETFVLINTEEAVNNSATAKLAKQLKLKLDKYQSISGNSFYLTPTATSRKGIYCLESKSIGNLDDEILLRIHFTVKAIGAKAVEQLKFAEVDPVKCAFCYTCFRACPHTAMVPDQENSSMKNLNNACQACGICVSICPASAVKITGVNVEGKANPKVNNDCKKSKTATNTININDNENDAVPRLLKIFGCENSGEIALNKISEELTDVFDKISISAVSCGGEITAEKILEALKDYEKVLYVTCMEDACRHHDGNKRARMQVLRAKELLKSAGLDENRVAYVQISHAMPNVLRDEMEVLL